MILIQSEHDYFVKNNVMIIGLRWDKLDCYDPPAV